MALSSCFSIPRLMPYVSCNPSLKLNNLPPPNRKLSVTTNCESAESSSSSSSSSSEPEKKPNALVVGTPIVVVESPKIVKTAAAMPCLRVNNGLLKPGDVGRIVSRKPKDVWVVRFAVGTFLIDGKYFKPLVLINEQFPGTSTH